MAWTPPLAKTLPRIFGQLAIVQKDACPANSRYFPCRTYNFGQVIQAAVWLSEATGNSTYLDTARRVLPVSMLLCAGH